MGKAATVPSDADVEILCSFVIDLCGYNQSPSSDVLDLLRRTVRAAVANEPGYYWDNVRAAWALLCRERARMAKVLRQEAACQNGKDRDDAPYAAAVLAMVADELAATTVLASPPEPPKATPLPTTPVATEKPHDTGADASPTIEAVVTVLARQALRAGTMHPNDTKRLLAWLSTSHNPNTKESNHAK